MSGDIKRHVFYIILSAIILIQFFLLLFSGDNYAGGDNISHFQIARYSFKYPELFLDLKGKPVYSTLLSPFTLFGYNTAKAFNLIVAVLTLVLTAKLSDKIFNCTSNYSIVLTAFSPVYFFLMITCLTEVLFSLFAVVAVYLFCKNKFCYSAIVLSFVPFICSEGMVLFPVFAFVYLLKRTYWPILFLCFGTVFYTIIGYFTFGDWLWVMHKFPYSMEQSVHGSGSLFYFIKNSNFIFGVPFLILLVLGLVYWLFQIIRSFSLKDENVVLFIIISGSWIAYFAAHSYIWWKGTGGSLGLIRVIGAVIPLAALTSVKGIQFISEKIKDKRVATGLISLFAVLQVFMLFMHYDMPTKDSPFKELVKKSTKYIKQSSLSGKVYCFAPEIIFQLGIDPYDQSKSCLGVQDKIQPSNSMEWGDLLVWDAHFGPNDGGVQLGNLEKDPYLKKIESFYPLEKNIVMGGSDYSVHIFKKSINKNDSVIISDNYTRVLSFENYLDKHVIEVDGFKVWKLDSNQEYSPTIALSSDVVKRYETFELEVTLNYKALQKLDHSQVLLVFSAENNGKSLCYESVDLVVSGSDWKQLQLNIKMPTNIVSPASKMLVYVWNNERKRVLMKSMIVNVKSY